MVEESSEEDEVRKRGRRGRGKKASRQWEKEIGCCEHIQSSVGLDSTHLQSSIDAYLVTRFGIVGLALNTAEYLRGVLTACCFRKRQLVPK